LTWFNKISALPRRWQVSLAGAILLVLIILFYPFQSTIVPRWRVRIVDDSGVLVSGINVTEHWQHYLIESDGHEDARKTDETGVVDFPARKVRASLVARLVDAVHNQISEGKNAKFGPYASLVIWGHRDFSTAVASYQPGSSPQSEVVVSRQNLNFWSR
jgi:hypothetical protein